MKSINLSEGSVEKLSLQRNQYLFSLLNFEKDLKTCNHIFHSFEKFKM
jgi:hypothetical protein